MKATIEFDLNDPDDLSSYELHNKALDMGLVIWELVHNKRKAFEQIEDPVSALYNWLWAELEDRGINIDKLIK